MMNTPHIHIHFLMDFLGLWDYAEENNSQELMNSLTDALNTFCKMNRYPQKLADELLAHLEGAKFTVDTQGTFSIMEIVEANEEAITQEEINSLFELGEGESIQIGHVYVERISQY